MTYLVDNLIKEIEAGGPVPSFPKEFHGRPMLEKEREAVDLDSKRSREVHDSQKTQVQEPREDWVRKKWDWYYEPNKDGVFKPQLNRMNPAQFEEYMKDARVHGKHRASAASRHLGMSGWLVEEERTPPARPEVKPEIEPEIKPKMKPSGSPKRKLATPAAKLPTVDAKVERHSKKPRVKAHITKEQYLREH